MEEAERLSNQADLFLPRLSNTNLILVLSTKGTGTEGEPDVTPNKRNLMGWIQKHYEEKVIEDLEKDASGNTTRLQKLLTHFQKLKNGDTNGIDHQLHGDGSQHNVGGEREALWRE